MEEFAEFFSTERVEDLMTKLQEILLSISATDQVTIEQCSQRDQMIRSALGLVFILNYGILLLAWIKVCMRYFGLPGILAGFLVPSIFLGLDRIIAMRHRHLTGVLAIYSLGNGADDKTEVRLRITMALALSLCTTFTFQMDQANSLIRAKAQQQHKAANSGLRQELSAQIDAEFDQKRGDVARQVAVLEEQRARTKKDLDAAAGMASAAVVEAKAARDEQDRQLGGVDGRAEGGGAKFKAQRSIAQRNETIAADAKQGQNAAQKTLAGVDAQLQTVRQQAIGTEVEKARRLAQLDAAMAADSRFVPEKTGLFADATIFVGLFFDPDVAAGMIVLSVLIWAVLLSLELSALIALALLPTCAYDIALIANLRVAAASMVAAAETELVRRASQAPPIQVRPFAGKAGQRHQQEN